MAQIDTIRGFISSHIEGGSRADEEDFFAAGLVSSMFVLQIVQFVERAFRLSVNGEDLTFDSFRSVSAIDSFVTRKHAP